MFITIKKHNQIIEHKNKTIDDYYAKIVKLEKELQEAKDLKFIINKFSSLLDIGFNTVNADWRINLPDSVLQYTDDILGGKVVKQEGNRCIVIDEKGEVKTGLTKQKIDKGYSYKLVRK